MARKKPRPVQVSVTAVVADKPPSSPAPKVKELKGPASGAGAGRAVKTDAGSFKGTVVGRLLVRMFYVFSSLQLAIVLLSLFASCLALATILESKYSTKIAQTMVYHAWWFSCLLGLLACNVLCAALKRYPWKKYQTGFLITHAGLLTLVFGGLLTTLGGTDGQIMMIDTDNQAIQEHFAITQKSSEVHLTDAHKIEIFRLPDNFEHGKAMAALQEINAGGELSQATRDYFKDNYWPVSFDPGPFTWYDDDKIKVALPWDLRLLNALASPFPGLSRDSATELGKAKANLTVKNFYSHAEYWPYAEAGPEDKQARTMPALKIRLSSNAPMIFGVAKEKWVVPMPRPDSDGLAISLDMMVAGEKTLISEFMNKLDGKDMGKEGQLVLSIPGKEPLRIPVGKDNLGQTVSWPGADLKVRIKDFGGLLKFIGGKEHGKADGGDDRFPTILFEVTERGQKTEYLACARLPHVSGKQVGEEPAAIQFWYHYPDFRWGNKGLMGSLQFLQATDGKMYYRIYGKDGLRQEGKELDVTDTSSLHKLPLKGPMELNFQVMAFLPKAVEREHFVPVNVRPGIDATDNLQPAIRAVLTVEGKSKEFRARIGRPAAQVEIGDSLYFVRYRLDSKHVDFELTLKRARQVSDPGTNRAASFQSDGLISYEKDGKKKTEEFSVYMNHTLDFGQYKIYQANYKPLEYQDGRPIIDDEKGRIVSLSGLTVAHDPGLWFKYIGSGMLVLGIATMFYMKAYFFKPRGKAATAA